MGSSQRSHHDAILRSCLSSMSSLMGLQFLTRVFTFILNQALVRMTSPRAYGTAAIQFEFMLGTILFLSREGIRNALLRVTKMKESSMNVSFLPVLMGVPLAIASCAIYARFASEEVKSQGHFLIATYLYGLSAVVELFSEPFHNLAMAQLQTNIRVKAEGLGITMKTVTTVLVLLLDSRSGNGKGDLALLAFAAGQVVYGASIFFTYWTSYTTQTVKPVFRIRNSDGKVFDSDVLRLSLTMTSQSVVKHFLTEGDKLILSYFSPLQDQGGYAVAVNYGSLVARIVFQPIEEMLRVFFSKVLSSSSKDRASIPVGSLQQASGALTSLLSIQVALSIPLVVFGTTYLPIVLRLILPAQYLSTSAPDVLQAWIWYIPVLALNGGLEAFLSSVATPEDVNAQSRWMILFSVIYILVAISLYKLQVGDTSLVYANIVNLSIRILYCTRFISSFFARPGCPPGLLRWMNVLPKRQVWFVACISWACVRFSSKAFNIPAKMQSSTRVGMFNGAVLKHVGLGGLLALIYLAVWIPSVRHSLNHRRDLKSS